MRHWITWLRDLSNTLWSRPDDLMLELGAGGELLVARLRVVLSLLILSLPLINAVGGGTTSETLIGLAGAVIVNVMAQIWLALARHPRRHAWLPYATGTYDVTSTTIVLVLLTLSDRVSGINSMVVWAFYLISIAMTALRNDGRVTLYVGALAMLQHGVLAAVVLGGATSPDQLVSIDYGTATVANQLERLVLLLLMTLITATIVFRMQRVVEMSGIDGLTGLPNRSWLISQMPRILEAVREDGRSLTLAMLDLDRFKRINDDFGPLAGDRAIRHFAAEFAKGLNEKERLVRLGGQEFVMLLHCPIGSAWERLDSMRRRLAEQPFIADRSHESYPITISGGLAAWPQDGNELSRLLQAADRRLQQAKGAGRNRMVARDA